MAKTERALIDWTKPIEHVSGDMEVRYRGAVRDNIPDEYKDEFKHAISSWKKGRSEDEGRDGFFVDDYGCVKAKPPVNKIQRIRNVVEKPASLTTTPSLPDISGPIAELTAALELIGEEAPKLRSTFAAAASALAKVAEEAAKSAAVMQAAVAEMRKIAAEQQTAYMEANLLLIEELRGKKPEPAPTPASVPELAATLRLKPTVIRDLAKLGEAVGDMAEIKNFSNLDGKELQETVRTLALASGVKHIVVGGYEQNSSSHRRGKLKHMADLPHGLKLKGYGTQNSHEIFVSCDKMDRDAVLQVVRRLG